MCAVSKLIKSQLEREIKLPKQHAHCHVVVRENMDSVHSVTRVASLSAGGRQSTALSGAVKKLSKTRCYNLYQPMWPRDCAQQFYSAAQVTHFKSAAE